MKNRENIYIFCFMLHHWGIRVAFNNHFTFSNEMHRMNDRIYGACMFVVSP